MPWWSVDLPKWTCPKCVRPATREVFNSENALVGRFCKTHALMLVSEQNRAKP